jgi:hypothetical protein
MLSLVALLVTPILALLCANQDFSPDVFITKPLANGVTVNDTLCPQHWVWFSINTRTTTTYTRLEQQGPDWVERPVNESFSNAVSLSVDAGYDYTRWRFTTLAVLMVNGTPPVDIDSDEPYSEAEFAETLHVWEPYTDRETLAMGFNETLGVSCQEPIAEEIFVGIQCVSPVGCASRLSPLASCLPPPASCRPPAAQPARASGPLHECIRGPPLARSPRLTHCCTAGPTRALTWSPRLCCPTSCTTASTSRRGSSRPGLWCRDSHRRGTTIVCRSDPTIRSRRYAAPPLLRTRVVRRVGGGGGSLGPGDAWGQGRVGPPPPPSYSTLSFLPHARRCVCRAWRMVGPCTKQTARA